MLRDAMSSQGPTLIIKAAMTSMKQMGSIINVLQSTMSNGASTSSKGSKS